MENQKRFESVYLLNSMLLKFKQYKAKCEEENFNKQQLSTPEDRKICNLIGKIREENIKDDLKLSKPTSPQPEKTDKNKLIKKKTTRDIEMTNHSQLLQIES